MNRNKTATPELNFLDEISADRQFSYRSPKWLKNLFTLHEWNCELAGRKFSIDFRIKLSDGSSLLDKKNEVILETFKTWIAVQGHLDTIGNGILVDKVIFNNISKVARLIDYFLLNQKYFQIARYGLSSISGNDLKRLLVDISSKRLTSESIYCWSAQVESYLRIYGVNLAEDSFDRAISECPAILHIRHDLYEKRLLLTDAELIRARAYLWIEGAYQYEKYKAYKFSVISLKLTSRILSNTLWGHNVSVIFDELCLIPQPTYFREFLQAPVQTALADKMQRSNLNAWRVALRSLGLLSEVALPIPQSALDEISGDSFVNSILFKVPGRYQTLPQSLAVNSLKNSVEFILDYGDDLLRSYIEIAKATHFDVDRFQTLLNGGLIQNYLVGKAKKMGIKSWIVSIPRSLENNELSENRVLDNSRYFERLRANEGLQELLTVLFGCFQICIGTLMARRQGELVDLIAGECLDMEGLNLVFASRKTGFMGLREKLSRPLPQIGKIIVSMLEQLQDSLIEIGCLSARTNLFAPIGRGELGLLVFDSNRFNMTLDSFCDYFQTPINNNGERIYIRQHQLRRFFAMLFFWGNSFGGIETLAWFFGHTNLSQTYHYITESTPGDVIVSVKAQFATQYLLSNDDGNNEFRALLINRFSTASFSVLDSTEMEEYIEELLNEGLVSIEPEFLVDENGNSYKIVIKVAPKI